MIKLQEIYISSFGKLNDYRLKLKDGLNTICQENGFGKSTIASFVKAVFFGIGNSTKKSISENERKKFTPWDSTNKFGGYVKFSVDGKIYKAERYFGKTAAQDTFALYDELDIPSKDYGADLGEKLFDIDADSFERCLYVPQKSVAVVANDSFLNKLQNLVDDTDEQNNFDSANKKLDEYYKSLVSTRLIKDGGSKKNRTESEIKGAKRDLIKAQEDYAAAKQKQSLQEKNLARLDALKKDIADRKEKQQQYANLKALQNKAETFNRVEADLKAKEVKLNSLKDKGADVSADYIDRLQQKVNDFDGLKQQAAGVSAPSQAKGGIAKYLLFVLAAALAVLAIVMWDTLGEVLAIVVLGVGVVIFIVSALAFIRESSRQKQEKILQSHLQKLAEQTASEEEALRRTFDKHKIYESNFHSALTQLKNDKQSYEEADYQYKIALAEWENKKKDPEFALAQNFDGKSVCDYTYSIAQMEGELQQILVDNARLGKEIETLTESADKTSELANRLQSLDGKLQEIDNKAKLADTAIKCLIQAKENLSKSFVPKIRDNFQQYISAVTDGKYANAVVDDKFNLRLEENSGMREFDYFSKGTSDVAVFCLRLALIDAMYGKNAPLLILDDPFVNLDESRYSTAMDILQKRAKKCQVLYFTCRR